MKISRVLRVAALTGMATSAAIATAQSPTSINASPPPPPAKTETVPAQAAPDMQAVLDAIAAMNPKPIETLTPVKARLQPGAADGTKAVMRKQGMSTAPDPAVVTMDMPYGADPMQFARIYKPAAASGAPMPIIVYYHGGGWVIADVNTYDAAPRLLSKQLSAIVVSVEYRHAPEAKFPAQHEDAAAAYNGFSRMPHPGAQTLERSHWLARALAAIWRLPRRFTPGTMV